MSHNSVRLDVNLQKLVRYAFFPHLVEKRIQRLWFYCFVGDKPASYLTQPSDLSTPFPTDIYTPGSHILIQLFSLSSGSFISELNKTLTCAHYLYEDHAF